MRSFLPEMTKPGLGIGFELLETSFLIDLELRPWLVGVKRDPDLVARREDRLAFFDRLVDDVLK